MPAAVRRVLKMQCDGDWSRVTVDDDGSFLVHNNALQAQRFLGQGGSSNGRTPGFSPANAGSTPAPPAVLRTPPARAQAAPAPASPGQVPEPYPDEPEPPRTRWQPPPAEPLLTETKPKRRKQPAPAKKAVDPQLAALATMIGSEAAPKIIPGVSVVELPKDERTDGSGRLFDQGIGEAPDWATVNVDLAAYRLQERCRRGLPESIAFTVHPEVMALYGVDWELTKSAVRNPERVEVRPETRQKKYPILAFYRGDIEVILGMRLPKSPAIIAIYVGSRLEADTHHVGSGKSGGGGARKTQGLPKNPRQVVNQLRSAGAVIQDEGSWFGEKQTGVTFRGQDLGKINVDPNTARSVCETDYQRVLRRINGIKEREGVAV
jgi:hypothetical protein